jgi:hypothetical protein
MPDCFPPEGGYSRTERGVAVWPQKIGTGNFNHTPVNAWRFLFFLSLFSLEWSEYSIKLELRGIAHRQFAIHFPRRSNCVHFWGEPVFLSLCTFHTRNGEAGSGENMVIASWKVIIPVEWVRGHGTVYMCESWQASLGTSTGYISWFWPVHCSCFSLSTS